MQLIPAVLLRLWFRAKTSRPTIHFFDRLPLIGFVDLLGFLNDYPDYVAYFDLLKTPLHVVVTAPVEAAYLHKAGVITVSDQGRVG